MPVDFEVELPGPVRLYPDQPYYRFDIILALNAQIPKGYKRCTLRFDHYDYQGNTLAYAVEYGYYDGSRIALRGKAVPAMPLPRPARPEPFDATCTLHVEPVQSFKELLNDPLLNDSRTQVVIATGTRSTDQSENKLVSMINFSAVPAINAKQGVGNLTADVYTNSVGREKVQVFSDFRLCISPPALEQTLANPSQEQIAEIPQFQKPDSGEPGTAQPTRLYPRTAYGEWDHDGDIWNYPAGRGVYYLEHYVDIDVLAPDGSHARAEATGRNWAYAIADTSGKLYTYAGYVYLTSPQSIRWPSGFEGTAQFYWRTV